jgi:UDP-glucose:(heptosyl)LPS alpha-1,3-glucosyltransferase
VRIAVLIDRFRPGLGGAEAWLAGLARAATERGDETILVTRDSRDPRGQGSPFAGWAKVKTPPGPRFLKDRAFARGAERTAREAGADATLGVRHVLSCDVYQPHGGVHRAALEATLEAMESRVARAARRTARSLSPKQKALLSFEETLLAKGGARTVIALSRRVLRDLDRWYPGASARARLIPPGVDLDRFRPAPRTAPPRKGPLVAAFLAHQARLKGLAPLLEALARVRRGGVDLRLAAGGAFAPGPWRRRAKRLGIADAVEFQGPVRAPAAFFHGADLLAYPTFYDPCSLVVLEALASGLPVVTTEANGAGEWIRPGGGEVVADPRDAVALASALARVAASARAPETKDAARLSAEAAGGVARLGEVLDLLEAAKSATS